MLVGSPPPLQGVSVVVTREAAQGQKVRAQLEELGAEVVFCPMLAFTQPDDSRPLEACWERLEEFDWVLFTSANGVHTFLQALHGRGLDVRALGRSRLGAIGSGTAQALAQWHLNPDCVPKESVAEGFLAALEGFPLKGRRILLARAQEARERLPEGLRQRGAEVEVVPVYKTVTPNILPETVAQARGAEWVLLASSSGARNYARLVGVLPSQKVLAIGPITAESARALGWVRVDTATDTTMEGMLEALRKAPPSPSQDKAQIPRS